MALSEEPRAEWLERLGAGAAVGLVLIHRERGPVYVNAYAERLLGKGLRELQAGWAARDGAWYDGFGSAPSGTLMHPLRRALELGQVGRREGLRVHAAHGGTRAFTFVAAPVEDMVVCTLVEGANVAPTELWEREVEIRAAQLDAARLRREARTDPLTGLLNRRGFEETYARVQARVGRDHARFGLLLVDLDGFKLVNDRYGHEAGDSVLREVAGLLQVTTRATDKLARVGGDEFVVLLPDADADQLELIRSRLRERLRVRRGDLEITASVGGVLGADEPIADLLAAADAAMYADKQRRQGE